MTLRIVCLILFTVHLIPSEPLPNDGDMQLKLVQVVWRHGDRNPTQTYPGDPYNQSFWDERGGKGELTTHGMEEQVSLGYKLRKRYIEKGKFLSSGYNAAEIYVRSTDVNRTLVSAMSNMIGMYGQGQGSTPGKQYPKKFDDPKLKWPGAFVPVAVHTVDYQTDYLGNANAYCPRQWTLWGYAVQNAPEFDILRKDKGTIQVQQILNASTGHYYPLEDLWMPFDPMFIEMDNNLKLPPWVTPVFMDKLTRINHRLVDFQNGIGLKTLNGINFAVELPKVRAGALTNDVAMHMNLKIDCEGSLDVKKCSWINKLKFYAYSAHDETISAFLATLGAKSAIVPNGNPKYSAAVAVELWTNKKTKRNYFKLVFYKGSGDSFDIVTRSVVGCEKSPVYCDLDVFRQRAALYNAGDTYELCQNTNLFNNGSHNDAILAQTDTYTKAAQYHGLLSTMMFVIFTALHL